MKVYVVYFGSRYLGSSLIGMYRNAEMAADVAVGILNDQKGKWWRRKEECNVMRAWQSTWDEIIIYEYYVN